MAMPKKSQNAIAHDLESLNFKILQKLQIYMNTKFAKVTWLNLSYRFPSRSKAGCTSLFH